MTEIWKDVVGYEGLYMVSSNGSIKGVSRYVGTKKGNRFIRERFIKPCINQEYSNVVLTKNGKHIHLRVNRIVAEAFIPNPNNLPQVNHISENKSDNRVENLEWVSSKENANYGNRNKKIGLKLINHENLSKPILQYSLDGTFLMEYPSRMEAHRQTKVNNADIFRCCNLKIKSAGKYIWKYK